MKREKGFSLIELMVSMGIVVAVVGIATGALLQAERATQAVALESNVQENLRAGMHLLVKDLMQAGEGIPPGGISIPTAMQEFPRSIVRAQGRYLRFSSCQPATPVPPRLWFQDLKSDTIGARV